MFLFLCYSYIWQSSIHHMGLYQGIRHLETSINFIISPTKKSILQYGVNYEFEMRFYVTLSLSCPSLIDTMNSNVSKSSNFKEVHLNHYAMSFTITPQSCRQRELFYSFLETLRVIIHLNSRYWFLIVDFR